MIRFLTSKEQYRVDIDDLRFPYERTMYKYRNTIIENNIDLTGLIEASAVSDIFSNIANIISYYAE